MNEKKCETMRNHHALKDITVDALKPNKNDQKEENSFSPSCL